MSTSLSFSSGRRFSFAVGLIVGCCAGTSAHAATLLSHGPDPLFHDGMEGITAGPFSDSDASRFLAQATFGPTDDDISHLRLIGYQAWLNEQFAATPTYEMDYFAWVTGTLLEDVDNRHAREAWFLGALGGPDPKTPALIHKDQLRQRVAFALSEILVISDENPTLNGFPLGRAYYYDILLKNAFGNYRNLLEQITLSPAMGVYLNMMGNRRADLSENVHPDENYGREINQLFSVGLVMLNQDGTIKLTNNQSTPTYTQATVTNFAHVLTGWNWVDCDADDQGHQFANDRFLYCGADDDSANFLQPMVAFDTTNPLYATSDSPSYHDNGTDTTNDISNKQLLSYTGAASNGILADGGTAKSDLTFALDNIFNHPNVAPFISKQLIQRLVTSNPSPAYVARVADVFNNDGTQVRGNLKAVVSAILLDPEARIGQWQHADTFGKMREPLLTLSHFWRAMGAQHKCGVNADQQNDDGTFKHYRYANQPYRYSGNATYTEGTQYGGVAQAPLDAFTVFNFFKPSYIPSGEMATVSLVGPEFQLQTDSIIANSTNTFTNYMYYGNYDLNHVCDPANNYDDSTFGDVDVDHSRDVALAGNGNGGTADPSDRLVDAYNKRFMSGQMSPYMRDQLVSYLNKIDNTWANPQGSDWRLQRVDRALYLILSSPEYMIQK